jgi:cbb3-type cytochrome oxidase subunit 3
MKRKSNFTVNTLLSSFGTLVILVLFTAGICVALRKKLFA